MSTLADAWLRLAHVGMHPDRLAGLLGEVGGPLPVLIGIERRRITVPEPARRAALVEADERRSGLVADGVCFVVRGAPGYPEVLNEVEDSPPFLFVRGSIPDVPMVGIVGTRRCTRYGRDVADALGAAVSRSGWSVVSGLARGIDGAAHRGSLRGSTPGVAVLGCGIDRWYPSSHASLGRSLLEGGGAVISEYPPGTPPTGWRFPPRNRIISGLARAVVIVEAAATGGALITAQRALEQDRMVFAVPGDVTRPASEGCNLLIRDGAVPVLGAEDLIAGLSLVIGPPITAVPDEPALVTVSGQVIPEVGLTIDELAAASAGEVPDLLAELGRLAAGGEIELREGRVYPAREVSG